MASVSGENVILNLKNILMVSYGEEADLNPKTQIAGNEEGAINPTQELVSSLDKNRGVVV